MLRAVSAVQRIAAAIRVCGDAEEFTGRAPAASETYAGPSCVLLLGGIRAARAGSAECGLVRTSVGSDVLPDTRTMRSRSSTSLRAASSRCDWARRSAGWALVRSSAWPRRRLGRIATRATSPSSSGPSRARSRGSRVEDRRFLGSVAPGPRCPCKAALLPRGSLRGPMAPLRSPPHGCSFHAVAASRVAAAAVSGGLRRPSSRAIGRNPAEQARGRALT